MRKYIYLLLLLAVSCKENEFEQRTNPRVKTLEVTGVNSAGAIFNGEVEHDNLGQIIDHGFVWSPGNDLSLDKSQFISKGPLSQPTFSAVIQSNLESGEKNYVRAYVRTSTKTIFGDMVEFLSLGSLGPIIQTIQPPEAFPGDTVRITVRGLSRVTVDHIIHFEKVRVTVVKREKDSVLSVLCPAVPSTNTPVTVTTKQEVSTVYNYKVRVPRNLTLDNVTPTLCDSISMTGLDLKQKLPIELILLDNFGAVKETLPSKATSTSLKTRVAKAAPVTARIGIRFVGSPQVYQSDNSFTQKKPEITPIAGVPSYGDTITFVGKDIPTCISITGTIANVAGSIQVIQVTPTSIKAVVGGTCLGNVKAIFTPIGAGLTFDSYNFSKAAQVSSVTPDSVSFSDEIVIKGKAFTTTSTVTFGSTVLTPISKSATQYRVRVPLDKTPEHPYTHYILKMTECPGATVVERQIGWKRPRIIDFSPKQVTPSNALVTIQGENLFRASVTTSGGFFGVFTPVSAGATSYVADFNQIMFTDKVTKHLTLLLRATTLGLTGDASQTIAVDYDGAWTARAVMAEEGQEFRVSFAVDGKGYLGYVFRAFDGVPSQALWQYDPATDDWTEKGQIPAEFRDQPVVVTVGQKVYMGLGSGNSSLLSDWWEYNPANDTWTERQSFPGGLRLEPIAGVIDGMAYVGGGYHFAADPPDWWMYDPTLNTWTQKAGISPTFQTENIITYSHQGKIYTYLPIPGSSNGAEFSYDALTDAWSQRTLNNLPYPSGSVLKFLNDAVICASNDVLKIQPGTGNWTFEAKLLAGSGRPVFVINDIGYFFHTGFVGGGYGSPKFWSLDRALLH